MRSVLPTITRSLEVSLLSDLSHLDPPQLPLQNTQKGSITLVKVGAEMIYHLKNGDRKYRMGCANLCKLQNLPHHMNFWRQSDVAVKSNVLLDVPVSHTDWNVLQYAPDVGECRVKTGPSETWIWKYNTLTRTASDNTLYSWDCVHFAHCIQFQKTVDGADV